jgi:hypothetical protein
MDKNIYLSKKDIPLELIKVTYRTKYINNQLIDFIYDIKSPHNLIKKWDHRIGNPDTITAGLQGIHIYMIVTDSNQYKFIGKFTRK